MADDTLDRFIATLTQELTALRDRNASREEREAAIGAIEADLRGVGYEPWQLYERTLRTATTPGIRRTAVNQLHTAKVPESSAQGIANIIEGIIKEEGVDYGLAEQSVMALSLINYDNNTPKFPTSKGFIDEHIVPYVQKVPTREKASEQYQTNLGHPAHMLASVARFTVVHDHAYDNLLSQLIDDFYAAQDEWRKELETKGELKANANYVIVHAMEHLAELMEVAAKTGNPTLVRLLVDKKTVDKFNLLDAQRTALGVEGRPQDIQRYFEQKKSFVDIASAAGYKI